MLSQGQFGEEYEQLPMFTTAKDLKENYAHSEGDKYGGPQHLLQIDQNTTHMKIGEAKQTGLYEDIRAHGVEQPVNVVHGSYGKELLNGHHRMSTAYDINPNMLVPLNHTYDMFDREYKPGTSYTPMHSPGYEQRKRDRGRDA